MKPSELPSALAGVFRCAGLCLPVLASAAAPGPSLPSSIASLLPIDAAGAGRFRPNHTVNRGELAGALDESDRGRLPEE